MDDPGPLGAGPDDASTGLAAFARLGAARATSGDSRLVSQVKAGENRDATLTHDHVVRALQPRALSAAVTTWRVRLKRPSEPGTHSQVVAFVQDLASGDVLQTLALPLEGCR